MKVIKDILTEKARNKYRELSGEEKKYRERIWKKQISYVKRKETKII